ncbi:MAG: 1-phosphofructokinase [Eubacterium sp.]|nr:1-phosphofructokinase [Eubacterium sp.]
MVYTITFNPSLDYIVTVDDFRLGLTNRTTSELMLPGGKGINVSIVLSGLGIETTAIYFSAGFVGDEITRRVRDIGIRSDEIRLKDGCSRINLKLKSYDGTEINGAGPDISKEYIKELFCRIDSLKEGDFLVLAGSIPPSVPKTIYSDIIARIEGRGIKVVVDATGTVLLETLRYKPFLVKPNNHELGEIFGVTLETRESVIPYAKKLRSMGAENVIVSMAGEGAVFVASDDSEYMMPAPEGKLVNGVGAGDSMVAGFIAGYLDGGKWEDAFKMGVSAGSASAFSKYLATKEEIMKVYSSL